jgi:hypothetical protein
VCIASLSSCVCDVCVYTFLYPPSTHSLPPPGSATQSTQSSRSRHAECLQHGYGTTNLVGSCRVSTTDFGENDNSLADDALLNAESVRLLEHLRHLIIVLQLSCQPRAFRLRVLQPLPEAERGCQPKGWLLSAATAHAPDWDSRQRAHSPASDASSLCCSSSLLVVSRAVDRALSVSESCSLCLRPSAAASQKGGSCQRRQRMRLTGIHGSGRTHKLVVDDCDISRYSDSAPGTRSAYA